VITDQAMIASSLRVDPSSDYRSATSVIRSWSRVAVGRGVILPIALDGLPILASRPASDLQDYRSACQYPFPAYASAHTHAIRSGMRPDPTSVIGNPIMDTRSPR
jgi:hypothetical protein